MIFEWKGFEHLTNILEMEKTCFPENSWTERQVLSHLENGKTIVFHHLEVFSYVLYQESDFELEIFRIGTKPKYQKQGIGSNLLNFLKESKKDIILEVSDKNQKALEFYKKNGFQKINVRKNYYTDGSSAIILIWQPVAN